MRPPEIHRRSSRGLNKIRDKVASGGGAGRKACRCVFVLYCRSLFAGSQLPAPAEPQQQAKAIDFDALRATSPSRIDLAAAVARNIGRIRRVLRSLQPGRNATAP